MRRAARALTTTRAPKTTRALKTVRVLTFGVAMAVAGCGSGESSSGAANTFTSASSGGPDAAMAGTAGDLPANAPGRFGFGREASTARVAMWDIDVRPDGSGLPPGGGTVAEGREVYMVQCIACHGPTGTEGPNDRLVATEEWDLYPTGRGIGNYWPYATTLYDYIRKAMPQLTPGSLSEDEVYAVVAYLLYMNELVPEDAVMNAETLPEVEMPARGRFVMDDRTGGPGPIR